MSRRILVLWAGRHQRRPWDDLCADYRGRIERDVEIRDQMVKTRGSGDDPARMGLEGRALLAAVPDPAWTIALDPRSKPWSSQRLADELSRLRDQWPHPIVFLVGSDLGLSEEVLRASRARLSFGPMIFGHELARLILYEQIYRALSMGKGIKYHRRQF